LVLPDDLEQGLGRRFAVLAQNRDETASEPPFRVCDHTGITAQPGGWGKEKK
jgi:hypothetical protein